MIFIIATAIIIYFILIAWTWHSLGFIEKNKKVIFILIGMFIMYIITLITFQMTKGSVTYENVQMQKSVQNVLVAIFTGINGIIVMPQVGKILDKINEDEMGKEKLQKRVILLVALFVICLVFEVGYMKDTQIGILTVYHTMK